MSSLISLPASPGPPIEHTTCHRAELTTRWVTPSLAVIAARGELDAANAADFADHALSLTGQATDLVLDLTAVQFFSTAGFSTLHTINVKCAGKAVDCTIVPSAAVTRLLRICDPDAALPISETVEAAVLDLQHPPTAATAAGL